MRSSRKKIICAVLCAAVAALVIKAMDTALYPCTYTRNDVHTVVSGKKDVILLGSSNGKMNIVPEILLEGTGLEGHNLCAGGQYPVDSYYLAKLVIEKQDPKKIIFELDPGYIVTEKEKGNNYLLFYHEFPLSRAKLSSYFDTLMDCDFRTVFFPFYEYPLKSELPRVQDNLDQKLKGEYRIDNFRGKLQEYHENGWIEKYPLSKEDFPSYHPTLFEESEIRENSLQYVDRLITLCKENNVEFVALSTPLPGGALQRDQENFDAAWDYFTEYFANRGVTYYNFNREYFDAFSHMTEVFVDYDGHMSGENAKKFSEVLGRILFGQENA